MRDPVLFPSLCFSLLHRSLPVLKYTKTNKQIENVPTCFCIYFRVCCQCVVYACNAEQLRCCQFTYSTFVVFHLSCKNSFYQRQKRNECKCGSEGRKRSKVVENSRKQSETIKSLYICIGPCGKFMASQGLLWIDWRLSVIAQISQIFFFGL